MPSTEKKLNTSPEDVTIQQFETDLANWLNGFNYDLTQYPKGQQHLHNSLLALSEQIYNEDEKKTIGLFLNSALSLTFLIKDNPELANQFINYRKD